MSDTMTQSKPPMMKIEVARKEQIDAEISRIVRSMTRILRIKAGWNGRGTAPPIEIIIDDEVKLKNGQHVSNQMSPVLIKEITKTKCFVGIKHIKEMLLHDIYKDYINSND